MAVLLGAKKAFEQIVVAALIGAWLMVIADWLGQHILFPSQVAAGTLVSVIGGIYFIGLLIKGQRSAH
jgi:iron complex transport system permease protein